MCLIHSLLIYRDDCITVWNDPLKKGDLVSLFGCMPSLGNQESTQFYQKLLPFGPLEWDWFEPNLFSSPAV